MYWEIGDTDAIELGTGNAVLIVVAYVVAVVAVKWLLGLLGKDEAAKRVQGAGVAGLVGTLAGVFLTGIPLTLAGKFGLQIAPETFDVLVWGGAAVCWGWFARAGWEEPRS